MTKTRSERAAPVRLGASDRVAIIAGSGRLPIDVAESLKSVGHTPLLILAEGEVDAASPLRDYPNEALELGKFPTLPAVFARHGITHLVLAGGISKRPRLRDVTINLALIRNMPAVLSALARGDDGLLSIFIRLLERYGVKVVGAHELVPDLLAAEGPMTRARPAKGDERDLQAALQAARAIGALDVGQAAVSIGGRVVALEGIEGTDGMLERVAGLRSHGRLAGKSRGVLVKCAKPGQELRADLPAIGPQTVDGAHRAGLAGIGVEAGLSLVLDHAAMVERADALGLFVVGLPGRARS